MYTNSLNSSQYVEPGHVHSAMSSGNMALFVAPGNTAFDNFIPWRKPKGVSMIHITCFGGGGAGGNGFLRTAGSAGGGGGGGGAGATSSACIPAILLPDYLFLSPGIGGKRSIGAAPRATYVSIDRSVAAPFMIIVAPAGGNGGNGANNAAGAAGTAGNAATLNIASPLAHHIGYAFSRAGAAGGAGGAQTGAQGTNMTIWTGQNHTGPGAGGAGSSGTDFIGGGQKASVQMNLGGDGFYSNAVGGVAAGGAAGGGNGGVGVCRIKPYILVSGGAGGGSGNAGAGGAGGAGGWGCGGGGGGAGVSGGLGGDGGDGLILITWW